MKTTTTIMLLIATLAGKTFAQSLTSPATPPTLTPQPPLVQELLNIGTPGYGGTGCPAGELTVERSGNTLELIYNKMEIYGSDKASFARATCNVRLPVSLPPGHRLVLKGAITQLIHNVEAGDSLSIEQSVGLVGSLIRPKPLKIELKDAPWDYLETSESENPADWIVSRCGSSEMVTFSLTGLLRQASLKSQSVLWVDRTLLTLEVEPCDP